MSILVFGVFVCVHVTTRDPLNTFSCDLMWELFVKICLHVHILDNIKQ
jgi:hypothetical protein